MNVIVLYALYEKTPRKTIIDSHFCFSRYDKNNHYYYLNIYDTTSVDVINRKKKLREDISAIIVHYTAVAMRYDPEWWDRNEQRLTKLLKSFSCDKIVIPQDEYHYTGVLQRFIKECGIKTIFTCSYPEDYDKLYPKSLGYESIDTVFTGYVDEDTLDLIKHHDVPNKERGIDIGYRARRLPFFTGRHGQLKYELVRVFKEYFSNHDTGLKYDIENTDTGNSNENVFYGNDWIEWIMKCRTMLGCLGGGGLVDWDGTLIKRVNEYCGENPNATFEETEHSCFEGRDDWIHLFALSPRHFECAMAHTTQVLVEGNYADVFKPGIDYIEIKKDFSNIDDVVEKIKDKEYCEKIADNCYKNVIESGKYTYAIFVDKVIKAVSCNLGNAYKKELDGICMVSQRCNARIDFSIKTIRLYGIKSFSLYKTRMERLIIPKIIPRIPVVNVMWYYKNEIRKAMIKRIKRYVRTL